MDVAGGTEENQNHAPSVLPNHGLVSPASGSVLHCRSFKETLSRGAMEIFRVGGGGGKVQSSHNFRPAAVVLDCLNVFRTATAL
jgi:hypothetical protein